MVNDKISNLIVKLVNAGRAKKTSVTFPYSKLIESILTVLKKEGFIADLEVKTARKESTLKTLSITLGYDAQNNPSISDAQRVSKFSKRIYFGAKQVRGVRNGYGIMVLTTPKGIVSDKEAKKLNVGGEALFKIW